MELIYRKSQRKTVLTHTQVENEVKVTKKKTKKTSWCLKNDWKWYSVMNQGYVCCLFPFIVKIIYSNGPSWYKSLNPNGIECRGGAKFIHALLNRGCVIMEKSTEELQQNKVHITLSKVK